MFARLFSKTRRPGRNNSRAAAALSGANTGAAFNGVAYELRASDSRQSGASTAMRRPRHQWLATDDAARVIVVALAGPRPANWAPRRRAPLARPLNARQPINLNNVGVAMKGAPGPARQHPPVRRRIRAPPIGHFWRPCPSGWRRKWRWLWRCERRRRGRAVAIAKSAPNYKWRRPTMKGASGRYESSLACYCAIGAHWPRR